METGTIALISVVAYLLGAIPFAVVVARARGVDIFAHGSGNPGATNVRRVVGPAAGNLTFLLDFLKGLIAVTWFRPWIQPEGEAAILLPVLAMIAAILGHSYSVFIRFRGGKGVAVTMGSLLGVIPWIWAAGVLVWCVVFFSTRLVSLASVLFAISLPVFAWLFNTLGWTQLPREILFFTLFMAVLIVFRHASNLRRLIQGDEFSFKDDSGSKGSGDS